MQRLQHKHFTMRNEQSLLPIRWCYVHLSAGFRVIGNSSDNDKKRPWFKRYEA